MSGSPPSGQDRLEMPVQQSEDEFEPVAVPDPRGQGLSPAQGVAVMVLRTLALQILTAGVTIVVARHLTPAEYGLFAIAVAVQLIGQKAAELGLPAALVQQKHAPTPGEQAAVAGLMLTVTSTFVAALFVLAFLVAPSTIGESEVLVVTAWTCLAIPFYALRGLPMALMERSMSFGRVAVVDTVDTILFNAFALIAVLAGMGILSLALAVPLGAAAGMLTAFAIQSCVRRPSLKLKPIRPMIGFGVKVSALHSVYLIRELGFVSITAAVGGPSIAGFYAMARRLFSFPNALTVAVSRVSFPAISRSTGDERVRQGATIMIQSALVCALPIAVVAGASQPLVSILLGDRWMPSIDILLIGSIAMILTASIVSTLYGFELARKRPLVPFYAGVAEIAVSFVVVAVLVDPMGNAGVGVAMTLGAIASAAVLASLTDSRLRRAFVPVLRITAICVLAAAAGYLLDLSHDFGGLVATISVVTAVWLSLEVLFDRRNFRQAIRAVPAILRRRRLEEPS